MDQEHSSTLLGEEEANLHLSAEGTTSEETVPWKVVTSGADGPKAPTSSAEPAPATQLTHTSVVPPPPPAPTHHLAPTDGTIMGPPEPTKVKCKTPKPPASNTNLSVPHPPAPQQFLTQKDISVVPNSLTSFSGHGRYCSPYYGYRSSDAQSLMATITRNPEGAPNKGQWGLREAVWAEECAGRRFPQAPHWPGTVNRSQWELQSAEPADAAGKQTGPAHQWISLSGHVPKIANP
ncbi:hypothetical protein UY3_17199 [Chelonia mydas]|uniref:Uncharacterized protein n=1 Tax=Chelonia mydas TaxID=8469 RepID=M7B0W8_CHEMY|nr:hypothetical protein UY3_17199 [Chelonia mydas]